MMAELLVQEETGTEMNFILCDTLNIDRMCSAVGEI